MLVKIAWEGPLAGNVVAVADAVAAVAGLSWVEVVAVVVLPGVIDVDILDLIVQVCL